MESGRIIYGLAALVLSLGACSSDKTGSTTESADGFAATEGNTLLAGQGGQTNGDGPKDMKGPSNDTFDGTTGGADEFAATEGDTLLAGQGGQTNGGSSAATTGQDADPDSSTNIATGDAAEIAEDNVVDSGVVDSGVVDSGVVDSGGVDSGGVDDIVVSEGQVLLPRPTGRYHVGLSERVLTPGAGPVGNADGPIALFTPYFTRIFYPIDPDYEGERFKISNAVTSRMCATPDQVLTHSYTNATMVPGTDQFPVVLFAPGSGVPIDLYISILEDLASHGYIVVAFQPKEPNLDYYLASSLPLQPAICAPKEEWIAYYESLSGMHLSGSQENLAFVALWVADALHTLDQMEQLDQQDPAGILTGRLDLEKVGMFGHSIGGAVAREACETDPRFKACGDLDGTFIGEHLDSPVTRPLMIQIIGDHNDNKQFTPNAGYVDFNDTTIQTVWDMTKDASAYRIVIRDIAHMSFADMNIIEQHFIWNDAPAGNPLCVSSMTASVWMQCITKEDYLQYTAGFLDPVRSINISKAYTRAFFDKHLRGIDPNLLKNLSTTYPEVTFEAKNP